MPFTRKTVVLGSQSSEIRGEEPISQAYRPSSAIEFAAIAKAKEIEAVAIAPENNIERKPLPPPRVQPEPSTDCSVLVVNNSDHMAKEITHELSLAIPGCSIIYAPTLELARLILKRRPIHLVVSSSVLPDGSVTKLKEELTLHPTPPEVLVVGAVGRESLSESGYSFVRMKKLQEPASITPTPKTSIGMPFRHKTGKNHIKELGADLRNDLNNPLQEIVAMAFVAKANGELSPAAEQALFAIERAAQNMSTIVNGLEEKIRVVVEPKG